MSLAEFDMRQLLQAGVHFGHQTHRWNPKMAPYIYGVRHNVHIIDLTQTVPLLARALQFLRETAAAGGRILFVGTKRQASEAMAAAAKRCGQHYVNHRWLGGMLTNWQTISRSLKVLEDLDQQLAKEDSGFTKKERLELVRQRDRLERALGGIRNMGGLPDVVVVIDTNREDIAVKEARKLNIPVVAVLDSNCDPDGIAFPVPGNDDATRAINLYCELFSAAVLEGLQEEMAKEGVEIASEGGEEAEEAAMPAVEKPTKKAEKAAEAPEKTAEKEKKKAAKPAPAEKPAAKPAPQEKPAAKKAVKPEKEGEKKTVAKKTPAKAEKAKPAASKAAPAKKQAKPAAKKAAPAKKAAKPAAKKPAAKKASGKAKKSK